VFILEFIDWEFRVRSSNNTGSQGHSNQMYQNSGDNTMNTSLCYRGDQFLIFKPACLQVRLRMDMEY